MLVEGAVTRAESTEIFFHFFSGARFKGFNVGTHLLASMSNPCSNFTLNSLAAAFSVGRIPSRPWLVANFPSTACLKNAHFLVVQNDNPTLSTSLEYYIEDGSSPRGETKEQCRGPCVSCVWVLECYQKCSRWP